MTKQDALEWVADGHSFLKLETAKDICKALNVPFSERLIVHYEGQHDANPTNEYKGLWLNEDKPVDGVNSLPLSNYIVDKMGLKVESYCGRGFQAQANAGAVKSHLGL